MTDEQRARDDALARAMEAAAWPRCRLCAEVAKPGKPCDRKRCPWQRADGRILEPPKAG